MYTWDMREHSVGVIKCHLSALKMTKRQIFDIRFYIPLYEKGIKENQKRPMETTAITTLLVYDMRWIVSILSLLQILLIPANEHKLFSN